ncbi:MAG: PPC domain-containing protein [Alphaproteobacteria bacterium]|nr:PPC domain-containing protein [Alphaproteobacteria bacterium]
MTLRTPLLLGALLLGGALVRPAQADEAEAESCLRNKIWEGYKEGWSVRTATAATLGQGEYRVYVVTLQADTEYRILSCADGTAVNVDLVIHDADGNVLASEDATDRQPIVEYKPIATDTYYVAVHARSLKDPNGRAGVGMAVTFR